MEPETLFLVFLFPAVALFAGFVVILATNHRKTDLSAAGSQASVWRSKRRFWLILVSILLGAVMIPLIYYGSIVIRIINALE